MKIQAYSEFGFILWYFLPKAYYLHTQNKLESTVTRIGMKDLFMGYDCRLIYRKTNSIFILI